MRGNLPGTELTCNHIWSLKVQVLVAILANSDNPEDCPLTGLFINQLTCTDLLDVICGLRKILYMYENI